MVAATVVPLLHSSLATRITSVAMKLSRPGVARALQGGGLVANPLYLPQRTAL